MSLVRNPSAVMWELRTAWAAGWRVAVSLDDRCSVRRLEGHVQRVSATDAFVVVAGVHVPAGAILAVHRPSRLGDSNGKGVWMVPSPVPSQVPGQQAFPSA